VWSFNPHFRTIWSPLPPHSADKEIHSELSQFCWHQLPICYKQPTSSFSLLSCWLYCNITLSLVKFYASLMNYFEIVSHNLCRAWCVAAASWSNNWDTFPANLFSLLVLMCDTTMLKLVRTSLNSNFEI
jgi:hypothetical protein